MTNLEKRNTKQNGDSSELYVITSFVSCELLDFNQGLAKDFSNAR